MKNLCFIAFALGVAACSKPVPPPPRPAPQATVPQASDSYYHWNYKPAEEHSYKP